MEITPKIAAIILVLGGSLYGQVPPSAYRPYHSAQEQEFRSSVRSPHGPEIRIEADHAYTLAELIDLAERNNPETRVAWERSRAQAAALGIARSELLPTVSATALSSIERHQSGFGTRFYRQTSPLSEIALDLNYTVFDFGARKGRIQAEGARLLAANFDFNDVHRRIIFDVSQAYYRLLNAEGQQEAAAANLINAENVERAAEERLRNGLATLPDVLEARSATAQAQYDLQAVLGSKAIAAGDLATTLGVSAQTAIHLQPLTDLAVPDVVADTVEDAIDRALQQRPELQAKVAAIRVGTAERQQAQAAFHPVLAVNLQPRGQALHLLQQDLPWAYTADATGSAAVTVTWTVFDGGARRNRLAGAESRIRQAEAELAAGRDQVENQVWAAYSNVRTSLRQREAALALLNAATQSYSAALESYNLGVRNLLDVTNAQRVLAQARSTEIAARTQVLTTLADLAFRTGDAIK